MNAALVAADILSAANEPVAYCWQCGEEWPADALQPDGNGDPICPDCHITNEGAAEADAAAYRSYMHAGR